MHNKSKFILHLSLLGCFFIIFLTACRKENTNAKTYTYTLFTPIYKSKSDVLASINGNANQPVETAGKIYIKDNYIFLNEVDKGIHIIDNSSPSKPVQIAFLNIPGNQDIAVKGNNLYADMYGDLLTIDISDPKKAKLSSLLPRLFKERLNVNGFFPDSDQVAVDWIKKDTTVTVSNFPTDQNCINCDVFALNNSFFAGASATKSNGIAGSMAKMVMIDDYLYAISESHSLGIVNTTNAAAPSLVSEMFAGFDLQTIYPFENKLFLGSAIGMFMYDVSDPSNPLSLGQFSHGRACDPVVTDGDYAYVTLHAGSYCGGSDNELNVIDVKNLMAPQLVKSYPMTMPTGLCKDGDLLFICDGSSGVRLYNAKDPADLKLVKSIKSNEPYDIIAANNTAMIVTKDGLYQYNYSDLQNIRLLSFFSTRR